MARVSVVVPCFDRAAFLGACLESVAAQTFADWECLVVDDGSRDGSAEVALGFVARDPRFRLLRQEHAGAAAARNHGLRRAAGEHVAFLDADDLLEPDKLAWQVAALDADPGAVLVYGDTFQFQHGDPRRGSVYLARVAVKPQGDAFESLLQLSAIYAPLVRRAALERAGGFDETLPSAEDWDAWLRVARLGRVLHEPRIALRYRLHAGNKSADAHRNYLCARRVARRHLRELPLARRLRLARGVRRYFRQAYTGKLIDQAFRLSHAGDWRAARPIWRTLPRVGLRPLLRPSVLANVAWAHLPVPWPPWWRSVGLLEPEPRLASARPPRSEP